MHLYRQNPLFFSVLPRERLNYPFLLNETKGRKRWPLAAALLLTPQGLGTPPGSLPPLGAATPLPLHTPTPTPEGPRSPSTPHLSSTHSPASILLVLSLISPLPAHLELSPTWVLFAWVSRPDAPAPCSWARCGTRGCHTRGAFVFLISWLDLNLSLLLKLLHLPVPFS